MDEVLPCLKISECSLPSGWCGEMNRQSCGILWHISMSPSFLGRRENQETRFLQNVFRLNCWFKTVGCCMSLRCTCARFCHRTMRFNPRDEVVLHRSSRCIVGVRPWNISSDVHEKCFLRPVPDQVRQGAPSCGW